MLIITRNCAIDRLRARGRRPEIVSLPEQIGGDTDEVVAFEREILLGHVRDALAALPAGLREVLELAYFGVRTHREIAGQLNLPLGTVKTRLRQAVGRLRNWAGVGGCAEVAGCSSWKGVTGSKFIRM